MVRTLLIRGMLAGFLAGLLTFGFARLIGEPQVEHAIAFEAHSEAARPHDHAATAPELVSREVQAGIGLFTGVVVHATALGGLFALVFAVAHGRVARLSTRATAALLAAAGFVAVYLVPVLKYPASPPAVGDHATLGLRTALFFTLLGISVITTIAAAVLRSRLAPRLGGWDASLLAGAAWLAAIGTATAVLPNFNEVPDHFPAAVLWDFRVAAMGLQVVLWSALGLLFGRLAELATPARPAPPRPRC